MNNFYTLYYLVRELRYEISNKKITEVCAHRKDQIDLFFEPPDSGKLTFSASSPGTALYLDHRGARPSRNAISFFPEIYGSTVSGIDMVSMSDRLIRMTFAGQTEELLFMPFSSRPNLFLVKDGIILSSFKDPLNQKGKPAPAPYEPDQADAGRLQHKGTPTTDSRSIRDKVLSADRQFPRGLLPDVMETCGLEDLQPDALDQKIKELRELLLNPKEVLITADGQVCLLPSACLAFPPEQKFDSVNDAVRTLFLAGNRQRRLLPRKKELQQRISKREVGWQKQLQQFQKKSEKLEKADRYEHFGNLLMSHPGPGIEPETDMISLPDWKKDGMDTEVPVNKRMTLLEQAKKYYDRASALRKEVSVFEKKERELAGRLSDINQLLRELEGIEHPSDLEKWVKNREDRLMKLGLTVSDKQPEARPYRLIPLGGYEVWIGKNARSNDKLLTLSHKEDIWMHVQGASGSHLIIRNRGQTGWPDKKLLLQAASWAAAWSRQAGSSLVPVMMAKRKHVRKPKGALPGQVTVTKERVEFVKPQKPDIADT